MEECAELSTEASKALIFGVHEQRDLPTSNHERMQKEFNDVLGILDMLNDEGVELYREPKLVNQKIKKVEKYMNYSRELGILEK